MEVRNINNGNLSNSAKLSFKGAPFYKMGIDKLVPSTISYTNSKYFIKRQARHFLRWISKNFSSPQQRAVLGVTALCTQPFIDLFNFHIKKEDKPITVAKTIAKIVVGTTVGIILRGYAIKAVRNFTKATSTGAFSQCLLPKKIAEALLKNPKAVPQTYLNNYRNGLGTFIGTMGGLITNFLIDAPLTKKLTNFLHEKVFMKKEKANEK